MNKVEVYDTTLRDGQQGMDVAFSVSGKLRVAKTIHRTLPVTYIEGGWPGANPTDTEFFRRAKDEPFHPILTAFGMTRHAYTPVEDDKVMKDLLASQAPTITIVGKTDIHHVTNVFKIDPEENLRMIEDSIRYAREQGHHVIYDAEHFFDGAEHNLEYAMETLYAAAHGGAETIVLCDTNGGKMPWEIVDWVKRVMQDKKLQTIYRTITKGDDPTEKMRIGIHTHSDRKQAEANALMAVRAGVTHVQGTINGYGERAGNADILVITDALADDGYIDLSDEQRSGFVLLDRTVAQAAGKEQNHNQPLTGSYAFGTKAGMHQDATLKYPDAYAFKRPDVYGNEGFIAISNQSGKRAVTERMQQLDIPGADNPDTIAKILTEVKNKEEKGYRYVKGEASLELLMRRHDQSYISPFTVKISTLNETTSVTLDINGQSISQMPTEQTEIAFHLLQSSLETHYPSLGEIRILAHQIQKENGTTRIFIKASNGTKTWTTVGIGETKTSATWEAVAEAMEFAILHQRSQSE